MPKKRVGPRPVKSSHEKPNPVAQLNDCSSVRRERSWRKLRRMKSVTTATKGYEPSERMLQARGQANQRAKQTARTRKAAARWQRMSGPR